MNVLFVHNNFPAQFKYIAAEFASDARHRVVAIGSQTSVEVAGVALERYTFMPTLTPSTHPFARRFDVECHRAEQVLYVALKLLQSGFVPDLVYVHCGWGENVPLKAVFPHAKYAVYCEFYYQPFGTDFDFDQEGPRFGLDGIVALRAKNAATLLALADADVGISPTAWQKSSYPKKLRSSIKVCHEGVDLSRVRPNDQATLMLPSGLQLAAADEVLTYVARDLEPLRGFKTFMRALPMIQRDRPDVQTVIVGGDAVSYGAAPEDGASWREHLLREVGSDLDMRRIHFLGRVPYDVYLTVLQVSKAHVYLTYPFVLSWSFLEAMACQCRIVASDTAPVREVLTSDTGVLVPFFDPRRLADEVSTILKEPSRYSDLGRNARRKVERSYSAKECARRLARRFERLVETSPERQAPA